MPKKYDASVQGSGGADGAGPSGRLRIGDRGQRRGRGPARCGTRDAAAVGVPGRARRRFPPGGHLRGRRGDQAAESREQAIDRGQRDPPEGLDFLRGGARPPQPLVAGFIDQTRAEGYAVESVCAVLRQQGVPVAARTYRSWKQPGRQPAARTVSDATIMDALLATVGTPEGLYGRRKMTACLRRSST